MKKKWTYKDRLNSLENRDGVFLIESNVCASYHIGIKDNSIILTSDRNGTFCMNADVLPEMLTELTEVYDTYFSTKEGG